MNPIKSSFLLLVLLTFTLGNSALAAQNYDLKEKTPEVQQALSNRKARFAELEGYKTRGLIGEGNSGFVEIIDGQDEVGETVAAENRDRKLIYEAIVSQNNLGPAGDAEVKRVFAEVQRGKAKSGDKIQLPSGEWVKK